MWIDNPATCLMHDGTREISIHVILTSFATSAGKVLRKRIAHTHHKLCSMVSAMSHETAM